VTAANAVITTAAVTPVTTTATVNILRSKAWRVCARRRGAALLCGALLCASVLCGCQRTPLLEDLDARQATAIAALLDAHHIPSQREPSAGSRLGSGRWQVLVSDEDLPSALALIDAHGLPAPLRPLDDADEGVSSPFRLVPSASDAALREQRRLIRDLEGTFSALRGVTLARVHLSAPSVTPMSAAVLLRVTADAPARTDEEVTHLLLRALPDLDPARAYITTQAPSATPAAELARLGPWLVAKGSLRGLQALLVCLVAAAVTALCVIMWFVWRLRSRAPVATATATAPAAPSLVAVETSAARR
jgi:type III secretory pathway lipoprotein EscJ